MGLAGILTALLLGGGLAVAQDVKARGRTSYMPVAETPPFRELFAKATADKPAIEKRQADLLESRYDLSNRPANGVTMTRGKPVQEGVRVKLPKGVTWESLAAMKPEDVRSQGVFPIGFLPLPHPNQPVGGMVFPQVDIDEIKRQEGRDLTRFDLDFDLPERFLPEFPPPIFLTTRPDLGDVSQGKVVTLMNYFELFDGILNPKELEGLRLLLTPFPQQQFNQTDDRRSEQPSRGVACFDCHVNGHTNGAAHLVGEQRPQEFRHRIETTSLRGLYAQHIFASQRALSSVEDFTEFEQRAAYFDGDPVIATKKGVNILERGSQVHFMAEMQKILDFPPAPKLTILGRLNPELGTPAEKRGEALFFGKAQCSACHVAPFYTDSLMHDLKAERFYAPVMVNGLLAGADGPIKTFTLRGIKESPPYMHDGRLLTLEDTVEFFNLVLETRLSADEKRDLVAFLRVL
jgi:cytochrome c peroxidase